MHTDSQCLLNKAVRRNLDHFPADFRFELTVDEAERLRFQFGTLKRGKIEGHDTNIRMLFDAIRELATPPATPRREIGYHVKETGLPYRVKRG